MGAKYCVIGLMSGTSMDGLDLAYCEFDFDNGKWTFRIMQAETVRYNSNWLRKLNTARGLSEIELGKLDVAYGVYLGVCVNSFIKKHKITTIDFVASHGHTIHHKPDKGITVQIGNGKTLGNAIQKTVVCDFRSQDVRLGGQGAPLVPIGDRLLFSQWDACLNLGGFANISFEIKGERKAFDICPANIVLNHLTRKLGLEFDDEGKLAQTGKVLEGLLGKLESLPYYQAEMPKSLGIEWVEENVFIELLESDSVIDQLNSIVAHITNQISVVVESYNLKSVLVTGGGAFNTFLIEELKAKVSAEIIVPDIKTIDFKEALVFAFLAVLKVRNEVNVLKSVTGASKDHSSGMIY